MISFFLKNFHYSFIHSFLWMLLLYSFFLLHSYSCFPHILHPSTFFIHIDIFFFLFPYPNWIRKSKGKNWFLFFWGGGIHKLNIVTHTHTRKKNILAFSLCVCFQNCNTFFFLFTQNKIWLMKNYLIFTTIGNWNEWKSVTFWTIFFNQFFTNEIFLSFFYFFFRTGMWRILIFDLFLLVMDFSLFQNKKPYLFFDWLFFTPRNKKKQIQNETLINWKMNNNFSYWNKKHLSIFLSLSVFWFI